MAHTEEDHLKLPKGPSGRANPFQIIMLREGDRPGQIGAPPLRRMKCRLDTIYYSSVTFRGRRVDPRGAGAAPQRASGRGVQRLVQGFFHRLG